MSGITYLAAEMKQLNVQWEEKVDQYCIPYHIYDTLNNINRIILDCNNALSGAGMNQIPYSTQTGEIEKLVDAIGCMNRYVSGIPSELNERIDQHLFEGFNKHATETISRIHFNDFKTKNTVGLHESWAAAGGGYAYSGTDLRQDICLADFLGNNVGKGTGNGYASNTPTDCVQEFADLFKSDYEKLKSAGGLDSSKIKDLNDYLDNIAKMGEFDHKMYQPFKSFISGLLDVTIIKPLIECATGHDLITGEDLTSFELTMKGVFALVDIVTIGTAALATEGMELGTKETLIFVAKTAAVNMGANAASYTAGYISDAAGAPLAITMLLSMGAGVTVSKTAGKYFFKNAGGKLLGDCNVPGENVEAIKETFGSAIYDELNQIKDPQARYEYLLDKAKTLDVSTEKNQAIFYSGQIHTASGTKSAREIAENYADNLFNEKGITKLTLERTPGGKWMDDLKLYDKLSDGTYKYESLGLSRAQADSLWSTLSYRYAKGASGAVTAFAKNVPEEIKPKTVFWKTELHALRFENSKVTHINIR